MAKLIFYQPLFWLRFLKLVQCIYLDNRGSNSCNWQLCQQSGLRILVFKNTNEVVLSLDLPKESFKMWDLVGVEGEVFSFHHLPIEILLTFLQKYESLMNLKTYVSNGLVWMWTIQNSLLHICTQKYASCSPQAWLSPRFELSMLRNDTLERLDLPIQSISNNSDLSNCPTPSISGLDSNNVWSPFVRAGLVTWDDDVWTQKLCTKTKLATIHVVYDEMCRLVSEWLLMVPSTALMWGPECVEVESGQRDCPHTGFARKRIPYASGVLKPEGDVTLLRHSMYLSGPELIMLCRLLKCIHQPRDIENVKMTLYHEPRAIMQTNPLVTHCLVSIVRNPPATHTGTPKDLNLLLNLLN